MLRNSGPTTVLRLESRHVVLHPSPVSFDVDAVCRPCGLHLQFDRLGDRIVPLVGAHFDATSREIQIPESSAAQIVGDHGRLYGL